MVMNRVGRITTDNTLCTIRAVVQLYVLFPFEVCCIECSYFANPSSRLRSRDHMKCSCTHAPPPASFIPSAAQRPFLTVAARPQPFKRATSFVKSGTSVNRSTTHPYDATLKIGASFFVLIATITLLPRMPARC